MRVGGFPRVLKTQISNLRVFESSGRCKTPEPQACKLKRQTPWLQTTKPQSFCPNETRGISSCPNHFLFCSCSSMPVFHFYDRSQIIHSKTLVITEVHSATSYRLDPPHASSASRCQVCPRGRFAPVGAASCLHCPAGRFADAAESGLCAPCRAGRYGPSEGAMSNRTCDLVGWGGRDVLGCVGKT